jgi:hypothetical protein
MKGGLTLNFMLMMFCILFSLRAFGVKSGIDYIASLDFSESGFYLMLTAIGGAFLGLTITGGIMSRLGGSSFSVIYIIPALAFGIMASVLLAPIGFFINSGVPAWMGTFMMGIFYIMLFAIGYGFIRGMEV